MRIIICLFLTLLTFQSKADAWDNLTMSEANQVVEYLKKHPFIFDYCDCCNADGEYATEIYLYRVKSTEIVTCSWDPEKYAVKIVFEVIAGISHHETGPDLSRIYIPQAESYNETIFMNYTWGFEAESKLAQPLFETIKYTTYGEDNEGCKRPFGFPSPSMLKEVGIPKGYKRWYKKYVL
ncbi:MAG: hypothetical protein ACO2Z9_00215 [Crocinitomicaceae bacterium]